MMTLRPYHLASTRNLRGAVVARLAGQGRRLVCAGSLPAAAGATSIWHVSALGTAEGIGFFSKDNTREVLPT